jgi:photosystem II stability/assembly factor-like uncharacterized protein
MRLWLIICLALCAMAPSSAQANWISQIAGTQDLYDLWGSGPNDLYAVGAAGAIYHSTNGGKDWNPENSGVQEPLYTVWGSGPDNVYAAGDNGTILRSTDRGKTWLQLKSPQLIAFRAMEGFSNNDIYLVGDNGTILRSTDGENFLPQKSNVNTALQAIWGPNANQLYVVGDNGIILQSTNNGVTWSSLPSGTTEILRGIWGTSANNIFVVGYKTTILQSTDAGKTWRTIKSGGVEWLGCIWGANANNIFAVGAKGLLLHSTDGGQTFNTEKTASANPLYSIWGTSDVLVRIVGRNGTLLRPKLPDPTVTINAVTPGARIFIDTVEQSGVSVTKQLAPGTHQIVIKNDNDLFEEYSEVITVDEGEIRSFDFANAPVKLYSLSIANPPDIKGAEVFVDGVLKGKTPIVIEGLRARPYKIVIRAPGYDDDAQLIDVKENLVSLQPKLTLTTKLPDWATTESIDRYKKITTISGAGFAVVTAVLWGVTLAQVNELNNDEPIPFNTDTDTSVSGRSAELNTALQRGSRTAAFADGATLFSITLFSGRFFIPRIIDRRAKKEMAKTKPQPKAEAPK